MNYFYSILLALGLTADTWPQGQVAFQNYGPPDLNAPVFDVDCQTPLAGTGYLAQAYVGLTPNNLEPVAPILGFLPFLPGIGAGYIQTQVVTVPSAGTQLVYFQIRAWEASAGDTYEAAASAGGKHGSSNIVPVTAVLPPGSPGVPVGLESFCLVPEPRTFVLLGAGGVLFAVSAMGHFRWRS